MSNDNPYSESLFRTVMYQPYYLRRPFQSIEEACAWVDGLVGWHEAEHRHSGIKYVTPNHRHYGEADAICSIRQQTYEQASQQHRPRAGPGQHAIGRSHRLWGESSSPAESSR